MIDIVERDRRQIQDAVNANSEGWQRVVDGISAHAQSRIDVLEAKYAEAVELLEKLSKYKLADVRMSLHNELLEFVKRHREEE